MKKESKSAVFGLNLQQKAKAHSGSVTGNYDDEQEVWTSTDGQVQASTNSEQYTVIYYGFGAVSCDFLND